jgi:hypothetical protein
VFGKTNRLHTCNSNARDQLAQHHRIRDIRVIRGCSQLSA